MAAKPRTANAQTGELMPDPADESAGADMLALAFPGLETGNDAAAATQRIIDRLMQANSIEELLAEREAPSIDQFVGKEITFLAATWGWYRTDDGRDIPLGELTIREKGDKEDQTIIATAPGVTAVVYRAQQLGALPFTAKVVEKLTRRGQKAINLRQP